MSDKLDPPAVSDLMITEVFTVSPDTVLEEVVSLLVNNKISTAPVVVKKNGDRELVGIITEKDCVEYLSNEVFFGNPDAIAQNMMERFPLCVTPETDIFSAATIFTQYGHRHLPVVRNKTLVGIVSRRAVLEGLFEFHKRVAEAKSEAKSPLDYHEVVNLRFIIQ